LPPINAIKLSLTNKDGAGFKLLYVILQFIPSQVPGFVWRSGITLPVQKRNNCKRFAVTYNDLNEFLVLGFRPKMWKVRISEALFVSPSGKLSSLKGTVSK
jgi:hypothetical protein